MQTDWTSRAKQCFTIKFSLKCKSIHTHTHRALSTSDPVITVNAVNGSWLVRCRAARQEPITPSYPCHMSFCVACHKSLRKYSKMSCNVQKSWCGFSLYLLVFTWRLNPELVTFLFFQLTDSELLWGKSLSRWTEPMEANLCQERHKKKKLMNSQNW